MAHTPRETTACTANTTHTQHREHRRQRRDCDKPPLLFSMCLDGYVCVYVSIYIDVCIYIEIFIVNGVTYVGPEEGRGEDLDHRGLQRIQEQHALDPHRPHTQHRKRRQR